MPFISLRQTLRELKTTRTFKELYKGEQLFQVRYIESLTEKEPE